MMKRTAAAISKSAPIISAVVCSSPPSISPNGFVDLVVAAAPAAEVSAGGGGASATGASAGGGGAA